MPQSSLRANLRANPESNPLSNGRHYLAIPGPSVMPDRVLQAMQQAAPNIYGGTLEKTVQSIVTDLKAVARTKHNAAIYICNGHGVWEAALSNVLQRGDKVLVLATGAFGLGWAEIAMRLGLKVEIIDFGKQSDIDTVQVQEALRADKSHEIKAVLATHVDTATSVKNDIAALRAAMDKAAHPALFMVDCIASLAVDRFEMDEWGVDVALGASQKGLMTPPGLGFLFFNDKADQVAKANESVSYYWDWQPRVNPERFYEYFAGTAPTHHLFALREALNMLVHEEGIKAAWARQEKLANTVWAAFDAWGQAGSLQMNIKDAAKRSHAVTALHMDAPDGTALRDWVCDNAGVTLGIGLGMAPPGDPACHGFFRLGHMGHLNAHMVLGSLGAIDAGLKALGIEHGDGALEAATKVVAGV